MQLHWYWSPLIRRICVALLFTLYYAIGLFAIAAIVHLLEPHSRYWGFLYLLDIVIWLASNRLLVALEWELPPTGMADGYHWKSSVEVDQDTGEEKPDRIAQVNIPSYDVERWGAQGFITRKVREQESFFSPWLWLYPIRYYATAIYVREEDNRIFGLHVFVQQNRKEKRLLGVVASEMWMECQVEIAEEVFGQIGMTIAGLAPRAEIKGSILKICQETVGMQPDAKRLDIKNIHLISGGAEGTGGTADE